MPEHHSKRKVVITEATSGLEETSTKEFAGAGSLEALSARCEQLLEGLERQWGSAEVQCFAVPVRAGTQRDMGQLSSAAVWRLLDVFVNHAEGGAVASLLDVSFIDSARGVHVRTVMPLCSDMPFVDRADANGG